MESLLLLIQISSKLVVIQILMKIKIMLFIFMGFIEVHVNIIEISAFVVFFQMSVPVTPV